MNCIVKDGIILIVCVLEAVFISILFMLDLWFLFFVCKISGFLDFLEKELNFVFIGCDVFFWLCGFLESVVCRVCEDFFGMLLQACLMLGQFFCIYKGLL